MQQNKKINIYIKYTISFFVCACIIGIPILLIRRGLIGNDDSFNQEFPVFIYIGKYLRDMLSGSFRQYDFRIGLGDDVIAALNWHGFGDLFQIVSCLFPIAYSEEVYMVTMGIKFYFCGLSFLVLSSRYLSKEVFRIIGSLLYTFSLFNLVNGLDFWMHLNPVISFPFIICGIDEICENNRKMSSKFILSIAFQAMCGFYYLYIDAVLAILYYFIYQFTEKHECKESFIKKFAIDSMLVLGQAMLGVGIGAITCIPSIVGFLSSSREGGNVVFSCLRDALLYEREYYQFFLKGFIVPEAWESIASISIVTLLGVVVAFTTTCEAKRVKIMIIILTVGYMTPFFGSLMNGFAYCTNRWFFGLHLFLVLLAVLCMERVSVIKIKQILLFYFASFSLVGLNLLWETRSGGVLFRNSCIAIGVLLIPLLWNHRKKDKLLFIGTVCVISLNGLFIMGHSIVGGNGYAWRMLPYQAALERMESGAKDITSEEGFARKDIYNSSLANSMVMDYYGTTEYFSTLNGCVSDFFREMNISPGIRSATWILKGLDSREELLALLSVSQYSDFYFNDGNICETIRNNPLYLPLGFTYDRVVSKNEYDLLTVPEKQSVLSKAIVLEKNDLQEIMQNRRGDIQENSFDICSVETILNDSDNILLNSYSESHNLLIENNCFRTTNNSYIRVWVNCKEINSVYVELNGFTLEDDGTQDLWVGNKSLQLRNKNDDYYMGNDHFWVYVTELFETDGKKYFDIVLPENKSFSLDSIQVYQHIVDMNSWEERKQNVMDQVMIGINEVSGTVSCNDSNWLFLSIPYSRGWSAYIDGDKVDIYKADIGFMALYVPAGSHEIQLNYSTPGLKLGCGISFISLIMLSGSLICIRKKKCR